MVFNLLKSTLTSIAAWDMSERPLIAQTAADNDSRIIEGMLKKGFDPNVRNSAGETPLMMAAGNGNPDNVSILLSYGADPKLIDRSGYNALMHAVGTFFCKSAFLSSHTFSRTHLELEDGTKILFISKNADFDSCAMHLIQSDSPNINAQDRRGNTALFHAIGLPSIVKILLAYGANPFIKNSRQQTALDWTKFEDGEVRFPKCNKILLGAGKTNYGGVEQAGGAATQVNEMPFDPSMPDITSSNIDRMWDSETHTVVLVKNPKTIADRAGISISPITYLLTLAIIQKGQSAPAFFVTLEKSMFDTECLCIFDGTGAHKNLGEGEEWKDENAFVTKGLEIIKHELGLTSEFRERTRR